MHHPRPTQQQATSAPRISRRRGAGAAVALSLAALALTAPQATAQVTNATTPLGQAVGLCTDPMTDGAGKLAQIAAHGWQQVAGDAADLAALSGAHIGSILGEDAAVEVLLELRPQLAANFLTLGAGGSMTFWRQGDAILALSHQQAEAGEAISCYFAGPAGAGIDGYWDAAIPLAPQPQSGTVGTLFSGTVVNARDDITYEEYQLYLRVASELTPLPESFRYERVTQP